VYNDTGHHGGETLDNKQGPTKKRGERKKKQKNGRARLDGGNKIESEV